MLTVFDFFTFDKGWQKFVISSSDDLINNYGVNIRYNTQVQQLKIRNDITPITKKRYVAMKCLLVHHFYLVRTLMFDNFLTKYNYTLHFSAHTNQYILLLN